ncbi:MAG TPA: hypothetical protein VEY93_02260 [Longimicrobium sp.]|nr:hypothetical protein [Longimicrobium sp.]
MPAETHDSLAVLIDESAGVAGMQQIVESSDRLFGIGGDNAAQYHRLAVLVRATNLIDVADFVSAANRGNRLRALLIDSDVDADGILYIINRAKLRIIRNVLVHRGPEIPMRFLTAWARGIEEHVIATATAFDDRLAVRNCAMKSFEIGFDAYPALLRIPASERSRFVIDPDGLFLHWAGADVHLTMEDVFLATNPKLREQAITRRLASDRAFGAAVRTLRHTHHLKQTDIPGLTARHVRRIEHGFVPGEGALLSLAAAHGMDPDAYLEAVTELMAVTGEPRPAGLS